MKFILTPNPNPPYNLIRISPNPDYFADMTEADVYAYVIQRNKETGVIPCESEAERLDHISRYNALHPDGPSLAFPPVGPHYIVDDTELPGGSVSTQNDEDYFFDAWEWSD